VAAQFMNADQATSGSMAVAVDLGGTQIRAALVDSAGRISSRASAATLAAAGPESVIGQIAQLVAEISLDVDRDSIVGAGVSSPGPLDTAAGIALSIPTLTGFIDYPLRAKLSEQLQLPVTLENDGIAAAIGEWKFGAGQGFSNVVYVTVSTGIGGGIICDNRVLRGRRGMAGHVGHMSFIQDGELCACGNRGCLEAYASGTAFTKRAAKVAAGNRKTILGSQDGAMDAARVFQAARDGDALARSLVEQEADYLGKGFASLLHLYSPDILIMGGGLSNQYDALHVGIVHAVKAHAMPAFRDIPIVRSALGANSGLIGAASLAIGNV
jgi:glucokinase